MSIKIRFSTPLQRLTQGKSEIDAEGSNVRELIGNLECLFPAMKDRVHDEKGNLRRFINIYVNNEDIRFLRLGETVLKDGDEVSIISAITGG
jgi:molybdopterin synthase sulfur carrier subunit